MTKINQIYKCNVCGNMVEIVHVGVGKLVCCGQPIVLMPEKSQEEGQEKHLPIIEKAAKGIKVKVGLVAHPMDYAHYIEWIEILFNGKTSKLFLKPGEIPEAEFEFINPPAGLTVRAYCNIHGLWEKS